MNQAELWTDALLAASLFAVDPDGLGGIAVRAQAGPVRTRFVDHLPGPMRRLPAGIQDDALLGGVDLGATLASGRTMRTRGLLAEALAERATILAGMAERMPPALAGRLTTAMDADPGLPVVALDEGIEPDERPSPALLDRLAFHVDLAGLGHRDAVPTASRHADCRAGRRLLPQVTAGDAVVEAVCATCLALGIASPRAPILALRAARAAAALDGRCEVTMQDAAVAARLVLAARATTTPPAPDDPPSSPPDDPQPGSESGNDSGNDSGSDPGNESEAQERGGGVSGDAAIVLQAARAAIPAGLLARLQPQGDRTRPRGEGRVGARQKGMLHGRPAGVRAGSPGRGVRLDLMETLRAAAPWQRLRGQSGSAGQGLHLRREDLRVTRTEQRARSTTIFLVDASGSSALNRLAEAKGAVELLLADCYRRRDQVAVLAFRGTTAQLLLPPTRSLVRARRSLAGLPGGGGTPMAAGLEAGLLLAETVRRAGFTPTLVLLTDGRANVTRAGTGGRAQAQDDAAAAARRIRIAGIAGVLLDTSPRPGPEAAGLARSMGARYVPLPYPNAAALSDAVRVATGPRPRP